MVKITLKVTLVCKKIKEETMADNIYDYSKMRERSGKVVSLLIVVVLSFLIFYFLTSAWFGESEVGTKVVIMGEVNLEVETNLKFPNDVLEPNKIYDNMETTIKCAQGTDDAFIKIKIETDYQVLGSHVMFPILYVKPEHEAEGKNSWIYNEIDDCYYYVGFVSSEVQAIFNTGIVITNDINNIDKSQPVKITITVYAIQRHFQSYVPDDTEPEWEFAPELWKEENCYL